MTHKVTKLRDNNDKQSDKLKGINDTSSRDINDTHSDKLNDIHSDKLKGY